MAVAVTVAVVVAVAGATSPRQAVPRRRCDHYRRAQQIAQWLMQVLAVFTVSGSMSAVRHILFFARIVASLVLARMVVAEMRLTRAGATTTMIILVMIPLP